MDDDRAVIRPAVRLDGVTVSYGRIRALDHVSMNVGAGECLGIFGVNGAGKSTLFKALSGIVSYEGTIEFEGRPVKPGLDRMARAGVAHVLEGRRVVAGLTVRENLELARFARGKPGWVDDLHAVLEVFPELSAKLPGDAGHLSGGQGQMLALARSLLTRPRLLLLDEPSLGLAPIVAERLLDQLPRIRREWKVTVIVAEQRMALAHALVERYVVLQKGRLVHEAKSDAHLLDGREMGGILGLATRTGGASER